MNSLKYPIGKFDPPVNYTEENLQIWIQDIRRLPILLKEIVEGLSDEALNTPYREGGWTIRQVIHHIADSHMNSFIRFKLALTEEFPTIKPYNEQKWAELPDSTISIMASLQIIEGVHTRWVYLLESMMENDYKKGFKHPEVGDIPLSTALALYFWHGNHHFAHIKMAKTKIVML